MRRPQLSAVQLIVTRGHSYLGLQACTESSCHKSNACVGGKPSLVLYLMESHQSSKCHVDYKTTLKKIGCRQSIWLLETTRRRKNCLNYMNVMTGLDIGLSWNIAQPHSSYKTSSPANTHTHINHNETEERAVKKV